MFKGADNHMFVGWIWIFRSILFRYKWNTISVYVYNIVILYVVIYIM